MDKIFESGNRHSRKRRDYNQFPDLQGRYHDSMAEFRQVVFVGFPNLLDQAMGTKAFEHSSDLLGRFADQVFLDSAVASPNAQLVSVPPPAPRNRACRSPSATPWVDPGSSSG